MNQTGKERPMRIELTPPAWEAGALPLSYGRQADGVGHSTGFHARPPARWQTQIDSHHSFRWGLETTKERFLARVQKQGGCWIWLGNRNPKGYGTAYFAGRTGSAHRVAYILFVGKIPVGLQVDHLCRNRLCVRPDHLEPVTPRENNHRSPLFGLHKTRCVRWHEYTPENTIAKPNGGRQCRLCVREHMRRYYAEGRYGRRTR